MTDLGTPCTVHGSLQQILTDKSAQKAILEQTDISSTLITKGVRSESGIHDRPRLVTVIGKPSATS